MTVGVVVAATGAAGGMAANLQMMAAAQVLQIRRGRAISALTCQTMRMQPQSISTGVGGRIIVNGGLSGVRLG